MGEVIKGFFGTKVAPVAVSVVSETNHFKGSLYEETRKMDLRDIAKLIRKDLKAAIKDGTIPKVKTSVRMSRYSGGQSLAVEIRTVPEGFVILSRERLEDDRKNPHGFPSRTLKTDEAAKLLEAVEGLVNRYNFDKSDSQTDYFCNRFYQHVGFDSDLTRAERARFNEAADIADSIAAGECDFTDDRKHRLDPEGYDGPECGYCAEPAPAEVNTQDNWLTHLGVTL